MFVIQLHDIFDFFIFIFFDFSNFLIRNLGPAGPGAASGTGSGSLSFFILAKVFGSEMDPEMLQIVKKRQVL